MAEEKLPKFWFIWPLTSYKFELRFWAPLGWRPTLKNTAVKRLSMREKLQEHRTAFVLGVYQISVA